MRVFFSFLRWLVVKAGQGLLGLNRRYRELLEDELGAAIFIWIMLSILVNVVVAFIVLVTLETPAVMGTVMLTTFAVCIAFLLSHAFSLLFARFKQERRELFDTIRNGQ